MGKVNIYTAYHATDKKNVTSIINDNFFFKEKDTHWLGNGVYFFLDKSLVVSWGSNCPTKKYGSIQIPAIIESVICVDEDSVCDMRELQKFNRVKKAFDLFWKTAYKVPCTATQDNVFFERLECAFFNWITKKWKLNCIICAFEKRNIPIVETETRKLFKNFHLVYVETQMCVKDVTYITKRREILQLEVQL